MSSATCPTALSITTVGRIFWACDLPHARCLVRALRENLDAAGDEAIRVTPASMIEAADAIGDRMRRLQLSSGPAQAESPTNQ
jgi:hypothetical protein